LVACDDERIAEAVARFGGRAVITSGDHATGSDRAAEAAARLDGELVVNIQGDEPFLPPEAIDRVVGLLGEPGVLMSSACSPLDPAESDDPNIVKVVMDRCGDALYFSRSRIPFERSDGASGAGLFRHIGIYGFKREFLFKFAALPRTPLEAAESLEQLRALEHGYKIRVAIVESDFAGIDTAADLAKAEAILNRRGNRNAKS
jgi:3-deoxy-manno-octulosonate cytidylyltransferase (CMP-KDO synthetase)